ncbi:MAG: AAA family ATPase [Verrucomicrobia bacterium]|nr:AAA family ATPase [Verrucomicrobiota bacterium]
MENAAIIKRLEQQIDAQKLPHLLLFSGFKDIGLRSIAENVAKRWLNSSQVVDLHLLTPEGKLGMHSIQAVRRFIEEVNLAPYAAGKKAFIIDDAERMLPTSANALLKTLEEPPKNILIILLSSHIDRLLPTILSRCQTIRFCPEGTQKHPIFTPKNSFSDIAQFAKEFQKQFDAKKKAHEADLKAHFAAVLKESAPAQRQLIEQEIEGTVSVAAMQEVDELLLSIQAYYLEQERKNPNRPFGNVLSWIRQAKQAIERSGPIQHALESLLLQLKGLEPHR